MKPNHFGSQLKTGIFMVCRKWTGGRLHSIRLANFIWNHGNHGRYFLSPQILGILWSRMPHTLQTFMTFNFYMFLKMWCNNFHLMRKLRDTLKKNCKLFSVKTQSFSIRITQPFQLFHDFPSNWRVFELLQNFFYRFSWKINVGVNCIYFASKRPIKFQVRLQAKPVLPVCCNSSRSDILIHSFPSLRLLRLSAVLLSK